MIPFEPDTDNTGAGKSIQLTFLIKGSPKVIQFLKHMELIINGEQQQTEAETLQNLLEELNIQTEGIAVAINEQVISKQEWNNSHLKQNDNILIITATQGG